MRKSIYTCQQCGYRTPKWLGRCPNCGAWNSFVEEIVEKKKKRVVKEKSKPLILTDIGSAERQRIRTRISELDRVLGGGVVKGSLILLGGDPGIGKSTLALQIASQICNAEKVLYVSGEESLEQIRMRAERIGATKDGIMVLSETCLEDIEEVLQDVLPSFLVMDSIQTLYTEKLDTAPGSVGQVREISARIQRISKEEGIATLLIGHVTKYGDIAGPKTLEHIVDTVLYFEGDKYQQYRILRCTKNRFGSTNEIGIFEMTEKGLVEIKNPSMFFVSDIMEEIPGSIATVVIEGTRPLVVEIQALTSLAFFSYPQRVTTGFSKLRLAMLLAVLDKRAGISTRDSDTYINVAGGISIEEPAADLAVSLAVASSVKNQPIKEKMVVLGEVGLGGEIRSVPLIEKRLKEAERIGFKKAMVPFKANVKKTEIEIVRVRRIEEAVSYV